MQGKQQSKAPSPAGEGAHHICVATFVCSMQATLTI